MISRPRFVSAVLFSVVLACVTASCRDTPAGAGRLAARPDEGRQSTPQPRIGTDPSSGALPVEREEDWRTARQDAAIDAEGDLGDAEGDLGDAKGDLGDAKGEEDPAEDPLAEARARTEQAVDRALQTHSGALRQCYQGAGAANVTSQLRLRVHRTGYVVSVQADGADERVGRCLTQVLGSIRVSNVETDTVDIERTLQFTRGRPQAP